MYQLLLNELINYINYNLYNLLNRKKLLGVKYFKKYISIFYLIYGITIFLIGTLIFEVIRISNIYFSNYKQVINISILLFTVILPATKTIRIAKQISKSNKYNKILYNTNITLRQYIYVKVFIESILFLSLSGITLISIFCSMQLSLGYGFNFILPYLIKYIIYCIIFFQIRLILICINIILKKYKGLMIFFIFCILLILGISFWVGVVKIINKNILYSLNNLFNCLIVILSNSFITKLLLKKVEKILIIGYGENKFEIVLGEEYKFIKIKNNFKLVIWKEITSLKRHKELKDILLKLIVPLFLINFLLLLFNKKNNININIIIFGFIMMYTTIFVAIFRKYFFVSSEKHCIKYILYSSLDIKKFIYYKFFIYFVILLGSILGIINIPLIVIGSKDVYLIYINILAISYICANLSIEYFSDATFPNFNQLEENEEKVTSMGNLVAQILLSIYIWIMISVNSIMGILNYRRVLKINKFIYATSILNIIVSFCFIWGIMLYYKKRGNLYWKL